jgi:hypothetical protein
VVGSLAHIYPLAHTLPFGVRGTVSGLIQTTNRCRLKGGGAKNEIATDSDVHYKQAKHAIRRAWQMFKQSNQQDKIENVRRTLNAL